MRVSKIRFNLVLLFCLYYATSYSQGIDSLLTVLKTAKEDTNKIKLIYEVGWEYAIQNKSDELLQTANATLILAEKLSYIKGKARANCLLGFYYSAKSNYTEANTKFNIALQLYKKINDKEGMADAFNYIADSQYEDNKIESVKNYNAALQIYHELNKNIKEASVAGTLGRLYFGLSKFVEALKFNMMALKIYEQNNHKPGLRATYNNIGLVYQEIGNYPEALKNFLASSKLRGSESINVINIYRLQGYYDEVLKIYLKLLNDYKITGKMQRIPIPGVQILIGNVYREQGNYAEALNYLIAGIRDYDEKGKSFLLDGYTGLAKVYLKQAELLQKEKQGDNEISNKHNLALQNGLLALKTAEEIKSAVAIANCNLIVGNIYCQKAISSKSKKEYALALYYLNKSLIESKIRGLKLLMQQTYQGLAEVHRGLKNYQQSLEYSNLSNTIKDSLFNNESSRKIENIRTQYEVDKALSEEKLQQEKLILKEKEKHEKDIADEKIKQQQISFEEKSRHERAELEENFRHQTALGDEKINRENLLLKQKIMDEKKFAEEKMNQEKIEIAERERHERALYEEKIRHQLAVSDEKHKLDKLLAAKERINNRLLTGAALIFITVLFAILFWRQRNQKKIAVEKANSIHKMAELEMQSLRTQLNPHFMFNSLNSIQELILLEENEKSHSYLSRFGKLLRMLLENAEKPFIPLRKEIDFLQLYLALENLRIPDLQYSISTDPKLNPDETYIPNMILQPYIENAIWHGLSHKDKDRQLQIRIYRENGTVNYEIEDNGVGRDKAAELKSLFRQKHESKGMELLSKRFKLLNEEYSANINTTITDIVKNNEAGGTLVTIKVPVKLSEHLLN